MIGADTPDPDDGRIERDADGNPTGALHEGAGALVGRLLPDTSDEDMYAGLLTAQELLFSLGITAWQDAAVGPPVRSRRHLPRLPRGRPLR